MEWEVWLFVGQTVILLSKLLAYCNVKSLILNYSYNYYLLYTNGSRRIMKKKEWEYIMQIVAKWSNNNIVSWSFNRIKLKKRDITYLYFPICNNEIGANIYLFNNIIIIITTCLIFTITWMPYFMSRRSLLLRNFVYWCILHFSHLNFTFFYCVWFTKIF